MTTTQQSSALDGFKLNYEDTPVTDHVVQPARAYKERTNYLSLYVNCLIEVILS